MHGAGGDPYLLCYSATAIYVVYLNSFDHCMFYIGLTCLPRSKKGLQTRYSSQRLENCLYTKGITTYPERLEVHHSLNKKIMSGFCCTSHIAYDIDTTE